MSQQNSFAYVLGRERKTRSYSRQPTVDNSELEGSFTGSIAAKDRASSSLAKGPASEGPLIAAVDS